MAQEQHDGSYSMDTVVVTGSRIREHLSRIGQSVSIISREDIEDAPADNICDLLEYVSGVDVRQRGGHGAQADVSIRGGGFEQTLVLVDGVGISDPQTGHHNLDLPVNLQDIERIEVLKGPGARIYGQNAMAGAINIITREVDGSAVGAYGKYGDYNYSAMGAHGTLTRGHTSNRISVSQRSSTGHMESEDADFDIKTFAYKGELSTAKRIWRLVLGYADKDFGAYGFYSDTFPNQQESTETSLAYSSAHFEMANWQVMPQVYWRRHDDDFRVDIGGNWFRNEHRTDSYGAQLNSRLLSGWGTTAIGGEMAFESLESTNLDDHHRRRSGVFFEHKFHGLQRYALGLGVSAIHYSEWGWEFWPGAELNVELPNGMNWFACTGKSFRIPTFTELYYDSPANQGNSDLEPERAWAHETGLRWYGKGFGAHASVFLREEEDVIDWSRASDKDPWRAQNIAESTTRGIEIGLSLYPDNLWDLRFLSSLNIAYTYLGSERDTGKLESKYVLDHLRHQIHGSIIFDWSNCLRHVLKARYEERTLGDSYVVVDTRLVYKWAGAEAFLEATNLFDEKYIDAGFAPMPGRWIIGGIRFLFQPFLD